LTKRIKNHNKRFTGGHSESTHSKRKYR
jgi:hypothetical protein